MSELPLALAWKFLRGRRSRLLNGTARAALLATALGVAAMVLCMALMSGYREDLQRKLIGGNAAVVVYPLVVEDQERAQQTVARLAGTEGVVRASRVLYGQGTIASTQEPAGLEVTLRGVERWHGHLQFSSADQGAVAPSNSRSTTTPLPEILLGSELRVRLSVEIGDILRLTVLGVRDGRPRFDYLSVEVADTFTTGFSEFDSSWAAVERSVLRGATGAQSGSGLYELALEDGADVADVAQLARQALGEEYLVSDWRELNRELFSALKLQQTVLFFVLGLIVLVSVFNVASTLLVLVRERMRQIGVLTALGLPPRQLRRTFLLYGSGLALSGTLLGLVMGSGAAWLLTEFELIKFDPEVAAIYFISSVPFRVKAMDLLAVSLFTLAVTFLACWFPAQRAARVLPADALRYE